MIANHHKYSGILIAALLFFAGGPSDAASWRINNNFNRYAHFTSINAAMSSNDVQDGDTLYLDPGCVLTGGQVVSKRVTIIGPGYDLESGIHDVASIASSFSLRAAGIKLQGIITSQNWGCNLQADSITMERCQANYVSINGKHATIRQCRMQTCNGSGETSSTSAYCTIENCFLFRDDNAATISGLYCPTIRNNYIRNTNTNIDYLLQNMSEAILTNNIILHVGKPDALFSNVSGYISHNVLSCAEGTYFSVSTENNKQLGEAVEANIFTLEGTALRGYQLKDESPAKGYAEEGGDCGPYGGTYPYVPSGYPLGVPRFVTSSSGTRATDGRVSFSNQVTIQTK